MNRREYHKSIGKEVLALKNRVIDLLTPVIHRGEEGRHKEDILKTILSRHLPETIGINTGFIRSNPHCTTQLDVILTNKMMPTLFQSNDFVITTPSSVNAVVEVKTNIRALSELKEAVLKLSNNAEIAKRGKRQADIQVNGQFYWTTEVPWFALFSYESSDIDNESILAMLDECAAGNQNRIVEAICLGPDKFARFWDIQRDNGVERFYGWRIYDMPGLAYSYFISNIIWKNTPMSVDSDPWFALEDKEMNRSGSKSFTFNQGSNRSSGN